MTTPTATEIVDLLICGPYSTLGNRKYFEIGSGDAARAVEATRRHAARRRDPLRPCEPEVGPSILRRAVG
jgi:hypothetical protein